MTWVKLSDDFAERAARDGLSDAAFRTHIEALLWTMRRETGGWIRAGDIRRFAETGDPDAAVRDLVGLGWWRYPAGDDRYPDADPDYDPGADPTLFVIVASMDDQPEPDVIEARRRSAAERVRRHRRKMAGLDPDDPPGNGVTERVTAPVTERVPRVGSGRDYVPTTRPMANQDQGQETVDAAEQRRPAAGGTRRSGATPPHSLREHDGPEEPLPPVERNLMNGVQLQSPATAPIAREDRRLACPFCGVRQRQQANGKIRRHGPQDAPCRGSGMLASQAAQ